MDCSLSGFSVHGILQARTLEWDAISFFNAWEVLRRGQGFREKMLGPLAKAGSGKKKKEWLYFVQRKNKNELKVYGRKTKGS